MTPVTRRALWIAPCVPLTIGGGIGLVIALGKVAYLVTDWLGFPAKVQPDVSAMMDAGVISIFMLCLIAILAVLIWFLAVNVAKCQIGIEQTNCREFDLDEVEP